jgi:drug/metabolite transporter (DMT)-like permease
MSSKKTAGGADGDSDLLLSYVLPALFVLLWSSGYIGSKVGTLYTGPITFLAIRLFAPCIILAVLIAAYRAPWPRSAAQVFHIAVVGILLHCVCFGGILLSLQLGVQAGVVALISGVHPLVVAVGAALFLDERINRFHVAGLALGIAGVVLVVWHKLALGIGTSAGVAAAAVSLLGLSAGTLYQKRFCAQMDLRTGALIQHAAACVVAAAYAFLIEQRAVDWSVPLIAALAWMSVVLSLGSISIFYTLLRHGAAAKVSSLFFLMPPATAVMGWVAFGETFQLVGLVGMLLTVVGVAAVNLRHGAGRALFAGRRREDPAR